MTAMLDRFIIMDDVELADLSDVPELPVERAGLLLAGPLRPQASLRTEGLLPDGEAGGAAVSVHGGGLARRAGSGASDAGQGGAAV